MVSGEGKVQHLDALLVRSVERRLHTQHKREQHARHPVRMKDHDKSIALLV
jgi:hypothetical protein